MTKRTAKVMKTSETTRPPRLRKKRQEAAPPPPDVSWFETCCAQVGVSDRPFLLVMLDRVMAAGDMLSMQDAPPVLWRSTISRTALVSMMRGIADQMEKNPELQEDV
jgi:hypothetical protein